MSAPDSGHWGQGMQCPPCLVGKKWPCWSFATQGLGAYQQGGRAWWALGGWSGEGILEAEPTWNLTQPLHPCQVPSLLPLVQGPAFGQHVRSSSTSECGVPGPAAAAITQELSEMQSPAPDGGCGAPLPKFAKPPRASCIPSRYQEERGKSRPEQKLRMGPPQLGEQRPVACCSASMTLLQKACLLYFLH